MRTTLTQCPHSSRTDQSLSRSGTRTKTQKSLHTLRRKCGIRMSRQDQSTRIIPHRITHHHTLQNTAQVQNPSTIQNRHSLVTLLQNRPSHHLVQLIPIQKRHHHLKHKSVQLRLRQRKRALLLNRILSRQDKKWLLQTIRRTTRRHRPLLHRLQ